MVYDLCGSCGNNKDERDGKAGNAVCNRRKLVQSVKFIYTGTAGIWCADGCARKNSRCLGCLPKEIYFTSGGSEADNQAILSAAAIGKRQGKMHIISTAFEHHAVLHTLKKVRKRRF